MAGSGVDLEVAGLLCTVGRLDDSGECGACGIRWSGRRIDGIECWKDDSCCCGSRCRETRARRGTAAGVKRSGARMPTSGNLGATLLYTPN